jgi:hypothetical protein
LRYSIHLSDIIPQQYNNRKNYPALRIRVINCEIRVAIYTLFRLFGSEEFDKLRGKNGKLVLPPTSYGSECEPKITDFGAKRRAG